MPAFQTLISSAVLSADGLVAGCCPDRLHQRLNARTENEVLQIFVSDEEIPRTEILAHFLESRLSLIECCLDLF